MRWILILISALIFFLVGAKSFAEMTTPPKSIEAQYLEHKNKLTNPGAELAGGWTDSSSALVYSSTAGKFHDGKRGLVFDATAGSQAIISNIWTVPTNAAQNASAHCYFKTTATDYTFGVYSGPTPVTTITVTASSSFTKQEVTFVAASAGAYNIRVVSASDAAEVDFDDCYLGENLNLSTSSNSITPTIQKLVYTDGASKTYSRPSGVAYLRIKMVGGGGGGGGSGTASASSNGTAGINTVFGTSLLQANAGGAGVWNGGGGAGGSGTITAPAIGSVFQANGGQSFGATLVASALFYPTPLGGSSCFQGVHSGSAYNNVGEAGVTSSGSGGNGGGNNGVTNANSGSAGGGGGCLEAIISNPSATYSYTVGDGGAGGAAGTSGLAGGKGGSGYIEVTEYYTPYSVTLSSSSSSDWYVDATMDGANPSLGTSDVASYTEIIDAGLTLKPQSGSQPVGVMCPTTNAATAPSTGNTTCAAGSESVGMNFSIPRAGVYEVCAYVSHATTVNSGVNAQAAFQLVETPTNAQTITLEGGTRTPSYNGGMTIATGTGQIISFPVSNCSLFNWVSSGVKGIRLMYEQAVTGTPTASVLLADASTAVGQRNMRFTVRPWTGQAAAHVFIGSVTSKATSPIANEMAEINCDAASAVTAGSWWLSSVGNRSTTSCAVTISAGVFSAAPTGCSFEIKSSTPQATSVGITSATALTVYGPNSDYDGYLHCWGLK